MFLKSMEIFTLEQMNLINIVECMMKLYIALVWIEIILE